MHMNLEKKIISEDSLDNHFLQTIAATSEGERIQSCLQCGTCSATCPLSGILEYTPRHIFALIRAGQRSKVLSCNTIWICASCYKCIVDCPAQIKITDIMYRLKRISLEDQSVSKKVDIKRFYTFFMKSINKYGRSYELEIMMKYMMFRHPIQLFKQIPMGIKMLMNGSLKIFPHKIKGLKKYHKMVKKALHDKEDLK